MPSIGAWFQILGPTEVIVVPSAATANAAAAGVSSATTIGAVPANAPAAGVGVLPLVQTSGALLPNAANASGAGVGVTVTIDTLPLAAPTTAVGTAPAPGVGATPNVSIASGAGTYATPTVNVTASTAPATGVGVAPTSAGDIYAHPLAAPATAAGTGPTVTLNVFPAAAPGTAVGVEPSVNSQTPGLVTVVYTPGNCSPAGLNPATNVMTQAQWNELASWGVGGVAFPLNAWGQNYNFSANTSYQFSGSPTAGSTYNAQRSLQTQATYAHIAGIKIYGTIPWVNYYWGSEYTASAIFCPMLGSWNPSYTDYHGYSWADWNQMMEDLGDALEWMGFDGIYFDNEDAVIDAGSPTWNWSYYANTYGSGSNLAQEQGWAYTAGQNIMTALNGGRSGHNGNNYPIYCYCSATPNLGEIPGGFFAQSGGSWSGSNGPYYSSGGHTTCTYSVGLQNSVYMWLMAGMASETTGEVVLGDPYFYNINIAGTTQSAFSANIALDAGAISSMDTTLSSVSALGGGGTGGTFTLPANVYATPDIWPADSTSVRTGYGPVWTQADWTNAAYPALLANNPSASYLLFQDSALLTSGAFTINYSDNTNVSPAANYTPLGGTATTGISRVQPSVTSTATSSITLTLANEPTPNNWLIVTVGGYYGSGPPPTFTPSGGGVASWSGASGVGFYPSAYVWYGQVTETPSEVVTIAVSGSLTHQQSSLTEWAGLATSPFDTYSVNNTGNTGTIAPGSITPSEAGELLVVSYANAGGGVTAGPSGWTNLGTAGASSTYAGLGAFLIASGTGAEDPVATAAAPNNAAIIAFKPAT